MYSAPIPIGKKAKSVSEVINSWSSDPIQYRRIVDREWDSPSQRAIKQQPAVGCLLALLRAHPETP